MPNNTDFTPNAVIGSLVHDDGNFRIGDQVFAAFPEGQPDWIKDWQHTPLWIVGIAFTLSGTVNYTVSDRWPPQCKGDYTDGPSPSTFIQRGRVMLNDWATEEAKAIIALAEVAGKDGVAVIATQLRIIENQGVLKGIDRLEQAYIRHGVTP